MLAARGTTPYSLTQLYSLNLALYGAASKQLGTPRFEFDDFAADRRTRENIAAIHALRIPYLLIHLPVAAEFKRSQVIGRRRQLNLLSSLRRLTGREILFLHHGFDKTRLPPKIDLAPYDMHPNFAGLKLYAELVADRTVEALAD